MAVIEESVMELSLRPGITVVVAVASAGVIVVTPPAPPPLPDIRVPTIEFSASAGPLADLPDPLPIADVSGLLSGFTASGVSDISGGLDGLPGFDALLDPGSGLSTLSDAAQTSLTSILTTLASIAIAAGVAVSGLIATPYALLGVAVTSIGAAIASLGGVFTSIGTAVGALSELPASIAELIAAAGVTITQGVVTAIYDFLIKLVSPGSGLVSDAAATLSADPVVGLPDGLFSGQGPGLDALPADLSTLLSGGDLPDLTQSLDPGAALDFS
ncbi:MAG: hypothetical protein ACRDTN_16160, partial [Mycobacterium sp.]